MQCSIHWPFPIVSLVHVFVLSLSLLPSLCLNSLELKVISYERSVLSINIILAVGQASCIHLLSALTKRSVLDDMISDLVN